MNWYEVKNIDTVDSPALLIYPERIEHNINTMIGTVSGHPERLVPHVKTHKMKEVVQMQMKAGIVRFKCATISELEMCLEAGAQFVLMAYSLIGPKIDRFITLMNKYPNATIASLVDNIDTSQNLAKTFARQNLVANVYFDVNNGQDRTGHPLDENVFHDFVAISEIRNLKLLGIHVYDGHIRDASFAERKNHSDQNFQPVYNLLQQMETAGLPTPEVITCGSPSFSSAAQRPNVYCSPGTTLLWDWGYSSLVPEVDAQYAAVLLTRVISKPREGIVTTDLGHKSVGAENNIDKRIRFLNLPDAEPIGQSEEHLVLKVKDWKAVNVGDVLYGIPFHVCPSVALYDEAQVIRNNEKVETWNVIARKRKITV